MKAIYKGLDNETQLLVGIGAAVASGCIPCLEKMMELASGADLDANKLKAAAIIGQFVKDQPASHMKEAADRLLGTHLQKTASETGCPMSPKNKENADESSSSQGCCG